MDQKQWMPVLIEIRDNATGEIREIEHKISISPEGIPDPYLWVDGNYSCDCNRIIFFNAGQYIEDIPCSDGKFSIRIRDKETGIIYVDELKED